MSEYVVFEEPEIGHQSIPLALEASLTWFDEALRGDDANVTAAFFALEPRVQLIALDVMRSSMRAAVRIVGLDVETFGATCAAHYRAWLGGDVDESALPSMSPSMSS